MRHWLRRTLLATLALAAIPFQGCTLGCFTIAIPDFGSKSVQGVWLWRLSPETGLFERDVRFVFAAPVQQPGGEALDYQAAPADGSAPIPATTYVVRDPANPDHVTVQLVFSHADETSYYRASTYNGAGDSVLSTETMPL